mmetsp:Transcript_6063/g.8729  ORF Transcript_6063/g.8729 Transcript_6063/m.8729 type:complete len:485 (-) Transcript_6063:122-1576(-)|eukprot:CAMPEP_0195510242 /NCGR_PEP_ID=MMETSP0794_2-20130614/2942_1 /TAXON_ID=515487 /ORGANISM="Stephanopyxis turris, Strain CCMP 815" /LENGTH=484 /DNA_ID=CAMNT_0040637621 /DNA_START=34 /DNA_END=1488 /DNA_ORIENTATION=-
MNSETILPKADPLYGAIATSDTQQAVYLSTWSKKTPVGVAANEDASSSPPFRDVPFAILFYAHLAAMLYLAVSYGSWGDSSDVTLSHSNFPFRAIVYQIVLPCAIFAFLFVVLLSYIMYKFTEFCIKVSLVLTELCSVTLAIFMVLVYPSLIIIGVNAVIIYLAVWYTRIVWRLIPFAASNLHAALEGVNANFGIYLVAFVYSVIMVAWCVGWGYVAIGLLDLQHDDTPVSWAAVFGLLVSLYWTISVLLNTVQVTVAGTIGTWLFDQGEPSSGVVPSAMYRSLTYSFGSICFGSLVEAIVKALQSLADMAQSQNAENDRSLLTGILLCIVQCCLSLIEDVLEFFNEWAFVFVGIYGDSYVESGKSVMTLLKERGWTVLFTHDLAGYVLSFTVFLVTFCTGAVVLLIHPQLYNILIGVVVGIFIASVVVNVVKSAVNTVIVCFADGPAIMQENHPVLTTEMSRAWIQVFPDCGVGTHVNYTTHV